MAMIIGGSGDSASTVTDRQGRSAKISQKGEQVVGMLLDDADINFQYGIRPAEVKTTINGTGTVGTDKSCAAVSAGTGVGSAILSSWEPVRYRAGHESYVELSLIFRTPELNLNQYGGFINTSDRFCVGYNGVELGTLITEGGNDTFTALGTDTQYVTTIDKLDGTGPSGYVIDPQKINVYRLSFVWHGGLPLTLEVSYKQQWWPVVTIDFGNKITETHLENPHLPVGVLIERLSGTGTDEALKSGSLRGGVIGATAVFAHNYWLAHTVLDFPLTNARNNMFTLVNPATWKGKANHVVYELGVVTLSSEANKSVGVFAVDGATITGGGVLTDIDVDNSPLQYINGGTLSGGTRDAATVIKAGGERRVDVLGTGIRLFPNRKISFEIDPAGAVNGTFSASVRMRGEH